MKRLFARLMRRLILPVLPDNMKLPFRYWLYIFEVIPSKHELPHLQRLTLSHNVGIDIGANVGFYSYKMSKHFDKVYSFEINEGLTDELAAYNPGNIEIINQGLSSKEGDATLYIPVSNGLHLHGWASLIPNNCPDTADHIEKSVRISKLDSFNIKAVSLIKIDVEGHELEVLKGAIETLSRSRPIVLIEIQLKNFDKVSALFSSINYYEKKNKSMIGKPYTTYDYIFAPVESA